MSAFGDSTHTGLGNNGFEVSLNYVTGNPDPNHLICSNTLKLAFKSLLKRDASTKEKSITALLDYIKNYPDELDDDLIIITWVQMYAKLALDDSKKVRSTSHQVQAQFVSVLGKKYAKYLKDTIGIWMAGVFDTDRSAAKICNETITSAFGGRKEKVANLWKIFITQLLQYSYQVLAFETRDTLSDERFSTKDERETKYLRVLQAAIQLFVHALNDSKTYELKEDAIEIFRSIYDQELLYDCFSSKDFNLKRSALMALKTLVVSPHASEIITKSSYKNLSKAMIKGIKFDSKTNIMLYAPTLITMLDTIVCVTSYDPSFWLNIKKADEKLLSLLKVGSLSSEPIYYDIVNKLFSILPEGFIPMDTESFDPYYLAILSSVTKERSPQFLEKGWKVVNQLLHHMKIKSKSVLDSYSIALIQLMDSPRVLSPILTKVMVDLMPFANDDMDVLLDVNSSLMDALPDRSISYPEFRNYDVKHPKYFVESFVKILDNNNAELSESLLANSIEALGEYEKDKSNPDLSFYIINVFIKNGNPQFKDSIMDFMETLPDYITANFINLPLETLKLFSHSPFAAQDGSINKIVDNTYLKLSELNYADDLLKVISSLKHFNMHETKELRQHLLKHSKSASPAAEVSNASLYSFLTPEILMNLFQNEAFPILLRNSVKHYDNITFLRFATESPEFMIKLFATLLDSNEEQYECASILLENMEKNIPDNQEFSEVYENALIYAATNNDDQEYIALVNRAPKAIAASILKRSMLKDLESVFQGAPNKYLSLGNPLGLGLYTFIDNYEDETVLNVEAAKKHVNLAELYCQFISKYIDDEPTSATNIITLALVAEYASDMLFLDDKFDTKYQDRIFDFQTSAKKLFFELFERATFASLFEKLKVQDSDDIAWGSLVALLQGDPTLMSFYAHRLLRSLLSEKAEQLSKNEFEALDFKSFTKRPEIMYVLLDVSKSYLTCKNLEQNRTNTVANLIGTKKSEIHTVGLNNLIMLNRYLDLDLESEIPETFTLIAPQRCMMLLNSLAGWLDSDATFEERFKPVRIALMEFVRIYINGIYYVCDSNYPKDFIGKIFDIGCRLISENFNLINSEDHISLDLLYFSLTQYILLLKYKSEIESWDEHCGDIESEILEVFFKFSELNESNQPLQLCCVQFSRLLNGHIKLQTLSTIYDRLFDLLRSKNCNIQRIAASLLHKLIPGVQDNLVVEFTLSKKKVNEDGVSDIHLPKTLMEITSNPLVDYIEYEDPASVYRYLWGWCLIMDHFENITQQMRQDYISDLGETTLNEFLNFIFSELDLKGFKIHEDDKNYVSNYSFDDCDVLAYEEEVKKILVNLLYQVMDKIGGTFAQMWFKSIKNRQLQASIEKFISTYISPVLINEIMSDVQKKISIADSDFKVTINEKMNEIKCLYNIDEQNMRFSITLPPNYPLSQISVNGISRVGVDEKKWKSWIMSAQYIINFQNGSILDAVKHFKDNVSANFENFDDCAICYSILNAVDHSTPNKICPTCKHNFHSACLYRWFKSSGSSTCPLCRSKFQFKKHS